MMGSAGTTMTPTTATTATATAIYVVKIIEDDQVVSLGTVGMLHAIDVGRDETESGIRICALQITGDTRESFAQGIGCRQIGQILHEISRTIVQIDAPLVVRYLDNGQGTILIQAFFFEFRA